MKKIFLYLLLSIAFVGAKAQKGSHSLSLNLNVSDLQWKWYTVVFPHINAQDLLGLRYEYGISDTFRVGTEFNYKIDNESPLDYNLALSLNTNIFKNTQVYEDGDKEDVCLYLITGISYAGIKSSVDDGNKLGGRFGVGIEMRSESTRIFPRAEWGYDTKQKWFYTAGFGYRF